MSTHQSRAELPSSLVNALDVERSLPSSLTGLLDRRPGLLAAVRAWLRRRRADRPPRTQSWRGIPPHLRRDLGLPDGAIPPAVLQSWRR